jgi:dihydrofolate reductase
MRKIIYWVHTSIDGFIAGPNGEFDWPAMTDELAAHSDALTDRVDTFLYGRVVWDLMSSFWPTAEQLDDSPHTLRFAPIWRDMPKVVFSRTLSSLDGNARVAADAETEVRALKAAPGRDMLLTGGSELPGVLADLDLIDEYRVVVHPVVLGGGKRVLPLAARADMRLVETRAFDDRAVLLHYART